MIVEEVYAKFGPWDLNQSPTTNMDAEGFMLVSRIHAIG